MKELFDIPESLSPKVKWMKEHGIQTKYFLQYDVEEVEEDEFGNDILPWIAFKMRENSDSYISCGCGKNEEEALWKIAENLKIPFYK